MAFRFGRKPNIREWTRAELEELGMALYESVSIHSPSARLPKIDPRPASGADFDARVVFAKNDNLVRTPSELTLRALRQFHHLHLWLALRACSGTVEGPGVKETARLAERADASRRAHAEFVRSAGKVMSPEADALERQELRLRERAARDAIEYREAVNTERRISKGVAKVIARRRSAGVARLRAHLADWSVMDVARLLIASEHDWTDPPCSALVRGYLADEDDDPAFRLASWIRTCIVRQNRQ